MLHPSSLWENTPTTFPPCVSDSLPLRRVLHMRSVRSVSECRGRARRPERRARCVVAAHNGVVGAVCLCGPVRAPQWGVPQILGPGPGLCDAGRLSGEGVLAVAGFLLQQQEKLPQRVSRPGPGGSRVRGEGEGLSAPVCQERITWPPSGQWSWGNHRMIWASQIPVELCQRASHKHSTVTTLLNLNFFFFKSFYSFLGLLDFSTAFC